MKKAKFKVGDKVVCVELGNKVEGTHYASEDNHQLGGEYTVTMIGSNGLQGEDGKWIEISGGCYWHHIDSFEIKPDVLTIVLRRPVDRKTIEKFLEDNGYVFQDGGTDRKRSRIIQVHLTSSDKGKTTYNDQCPYSCGTKEVIEHTNSFLKSYWRYERIKVIKTKPSVTKAINQISKYI